MAKGILGSRFNSTEPRRKRSGVYSSTIMREERRTDRESCDQIFAMCKGMRKAKKFRNTASTEYAGRAFTYTRECRFENSYIHVACKATY